MGNKLGWIDWVANNNNNNNSIYLPFNTNKKINFKILKNKSYIIHINS